jgi:hypothetical protein
LDFVSGIIRSVSILLINTENFRRLAVEPNELSLILKPLLFATCAVYIGLLMGYSYLASETRKIEARKNSFGLWVFRANRVICGLILTLTGILLGVGWAEVISVDLVLWVSQNAAPERDSANVM